MAIAIQTHHTFTLQSLFNQLCQKYCADCGRLAAFIDVFTLRRVCLSVDERLIQAGKLDSVPTFRAIGGCYRRYGLCPINRQLRTDNYLVKDGTILYDGALARKKIIEFARDTYIWTDMSRYEDILDKAIPCVLAPWLSNQDENVERGAQCSKCYARVNAGEDEMHVLIRLYTEVEWTRHVEEAHGELAKT
jgi:hypothetical protein